MSYSSSDVRRLIALIADEMICAKQELTAIDSRLGDGDMGMSMEKGALALKLVLDTDTPDAAALLANAAAAFNRAAPSTLGTLLSCGIQETARFLKERPEPSEADVVSIPGLFAETISKRGRAKEGDKTILDALLPYAGALADNYKTTGDLKSALKAAAESARAGMERTKGMVARTGRAKWLADRNKDCPDGGAVLCTRIADCLMRYYG